MTIIVNAVSCKIGGAKQIVQQFLDDYTGSDKIILLAPNGFKYNHSMVKHIAIETSSVNTLLFSIFFVAFFSIAYRARIIFSFTNLNCVFPVAKRYIYFHQLKIFTGKSLRFRIFRFFIKYFLLNCHYIFQTSFVEDCFKRCFASNICSTICWPGCRKPNDFGMRKNPPVAALIPYGFVEAPQKNYFFFRDRREAILKRLPSLKIVSENFYNDDGFEFIGHQSSSSMDQLYSEVDLLLVASLEETVCLPIFEFACTGKPVLVMDAPYTQGLRDQFILTRNIVFYNEDNFIHLLDEVIAKYPDYCLTCVSDVRKYLSSQWPKF